MRATLYTDGGCRPRNPGPAGFACVLVMENGDIHKVARHVWRATNNEAEFMALIVGIKMARENHVSYLDIISDSKIVVHLTDGSWQAKHWKMRILRADAQKLLKRYFDERWQIHHVKGHAGNEYNEYADRLCTAVILAGIEERRKKNPWLLKLKG